MEVEERRLSVDLDAARPPSMGMIVDSTVYAALCPIQASLKEP